LALLNPLFSCRDLNSVMLNKAYTSLSRKEN